MWNGPKLNLRRQEKGYDGNYEYANQQCCRGIGNSGSASAAP